MIVLLYNYILEFLLKMPIWTIHNSFCTTIGWYYILKDITEKDLLHVFWRRYATIEGRVLV
ncbi:hypothetical protein CMT66_10920 [Elizabethkingia anophelis]|nr:hypothetical protein [Elizabethkingia anophelis]